MKMESNFYRLFMVSRRPYEVNFYSPAKLRILSVNCTYGILFYRQSSTYGQVTFLKSVCEFAGSYIGIEYLFIHSVSLMIQKQKWEEVIMK